MISRAQLKTYKVMHYALIFTFWYSRKSFYHYTECINTPASGGGCSLHPAGGTAPRPLRLPARFSASATVSSSPILHLQDPCRAEFLLPARGIAGRAIDRLCFASSLGLLFAFVEDVNSCLSRGGFSVCGLCACLRYFQLMFIQRRI